MMTRYKTYLPLLVFLSLVFFLWKGLQQDPHKLPSSLINHALPKFQAENLLKPSTQVTSEDFIGHVSVLNVFATWCLVCEVEHPVWMDIASGHIVRIYGLNYKDNDQKARRFLKQYGNPYDAVFTDPIGKIAIDLGVYGTPETFVIDKKGIIRDKYIGAMTRAVFQKNLAPKLKQLEQEP